MADDRIFRDVIAQIFPDPRSRRVFERLQTRVDDAEAASTLAVDATNKLNEAAFVTLSANAELPNERILQFGEGIGGSVTDTTLTLAATNALARTQGGFRVTLTSSGDALLAVPLTGKLATQEWVIANGGTSGTFLIDDGSATASGAFSMNDGGA